LTDTESASLAPRRRERQDAVENRALILAAAKRLFGEKGIDSTSMCEIGRAAGVGQGTLYRHFAHKGALGLALVREDVEAFKARLMVLLDGPDAPASAIARLDLLIVEKINLTETHLSMFAAIDESAAGPRRTDMFRVPFVTWLHDRIVPLLAEAVARGEIPPLDVEFTAGAIIAITSPALFYHQRLDRGYSLDRIAAGTRALFTAGKADGNADEHG
jgi:AcrR family transcriptional regulator